MGTKFQFLKNTVINLIMNTKCTNHNRLADKSSNHTYTKKELVGIKVPKSEHHKTQGNKIGFCCFLLPILPLLHYK